MTHSHLHRQRVGSNPPLVIGSDSWLRGACCGADQHGRSQHFNRKQLKGLGADGSYRLILAHDDPGPQHNWLDTEGRETG